jgi:hypothetical protein
MTKLIKQKWDGSVIEVDADSKPFGVLGIELSIRGGTVEIFPQYLQFAISDSSILELNSRHD